MTHLVLTYLSNRPNRDTVPMCRFGRIGHATIELPLGVRAITQEAFEARVSHRVPNTTALAWFEQDGGQVMGVVLRDHRELAFVAMTLRFDGHASVVTRCEAGLHERSQAIGRLLDALA